MKDDIHPKYQQILFVDSSTDYKFVCGSTLQPEEKENFEGVEYPVYRVSVSSSSHPFFTGVGQFIDTEGRIGKFKKKYKQKQEQEKANIEKLEASLEKKAKGKKKKQ